MGDFHLRLSRVRGASPTLFGIVTANIQTVMEKTKSTRGGYREGAGRKATGRTKKTITVCLSPDVVAILEQHQGNKSAYIEELIRSDAMRSER